MNKTFDFHFHLLFKHYITTGVALDQDFKSTGLAELLNEILGGPFDSQASPNMVKDSELYLGITSITSLEHAFANRILNIGDLDLSSILALNWQLVNDTKNGKTTYYQEFKKQLKLYTDHFAFLKAAPYNIEFLKRADWKNKTTQQIANELVANGKRYLAFSIEGGHNLSDVPIRGAAKSLNAAANLKQIQDQLSTDFISLNLCHLSYIPEQTLGGFAQGLNTLSQIAFSSDDFSPKHTLGLTEPGKSVIRQALMHPTKPMLIDVKHMSIYTRLHYYRFRDKLIAEQPNLARLPILSSHTGFTFVTLQDYIQNKRFKSSTQNAEGYVICKVAPENRKTGKTNDTFNSVLYCNSWTINLFDEEIIEIMESNGMIGLSLDQRILGSSNLAIDSLRDKYYEEECVAQAEWERLFRDGILTIAAEKQEANLFPTKEERHAMLLCLHMVHAVRLGYATLNWVGDKSPWDHICIGSDFDGLINPINGIDNVKHYGDLRNAIIQYLPQADKSLNFYKDYKALRYTANGNVDAAYLTEVVEKFMFGNGLRFMARFLNNWN